MAKKKETSNNKVNSMDTMPEEGRISTGVQEVDDLLDGGFPTRRITQIYGQPGVGKGYLLTMTMRQNKHRVLYVDAEYALNKDRVRSAGVDLSKVQYLPDSRLENVAEHVLEHINDYDLIIIDSLAALTPMTIVENEVGSSTIGLVARQIGHFVAKLRPKLYESNTAIVGINQVRANLGYGAAESKPFGGYAWGHAVDLSLKLAKGANNALYRQKDGVKRQVGHYCTVKIDKSRIGDFGKETKFLVDYTIGAQEAIQLIEEDEQ